MRFAMVLLLSAAVFSPAVAAAQGKFDGTWSGKAGAWAIKLVVAGTKGRVALTCTDRTYSFDIPVAADGTIDSWLASDNFAKRQLAGKLPSVILASGGGSCPGGVTNLSR